MNDILSVLIDRLADALALRLFSGRASAVRHQPLPKGQKRTPGEIHLITVCLLDQIRSSEGLRIEQLAVAMGRSTRELKLSIEKLRAAKQITTRGVRRGVRYFPT